MTIHKKKRKPQHKQHKHQFCHVHNTLKRIPKTIKFKMQPDIFVFERRKQMPTAFNTKYPKVDKIDGIELGHIRKLQLSRLQKLQQKLLNIQPQLQYFLPPSLKQPSQSQTSNQQIQHEKRIASSEEVIYHNALKTPIQPIFEIENNELALSPKKIEFVSEKVVKQKEQKSLKGILKYPSLLRYCEYSEKYLPIKNRHYYILENTKSHCVHRSVCKYYPKNCYKGQNCEFLHTDQ